MKVNGKIISEMVKVFNQMKMVKNMMENGKMINVMVKENFMIKKNLFMMVN